MPTFHIELFEGRSLEQKREFVEAITKATCESLGVEANTVDIILTDVKRENWATGGRLWSTPENKACRTHGRPDARNAEGRAWSKMPRALRAQRVIPGDAHQKNASPWRRSNTPPPGYVIRTCG